MLASRRCGPDALPGRPSLHVHIVRAALLVVIALPLAACPGFGDRELESALRGGSGDPDCAQVLAVMEARCNSCHGVPTAGGAPDYLRLDTFEDVDGVLGLVNQSGRVVARTQDGTMPPGVTMDREELRLLERWHEDGAPFDACMSVAPSADAGVDAGTDAATTADVAEDSTRTSNASLEAVDTIFRTSCAPHHYGATAPILDLSNGDNALLDRLFAPSLQQPDLNRVEPGEPQQSYLYLKLVGGHLAEGGAGARMPFEREFSDRDRETIRSWIEGLEPR